MTRKLTIVSKKKASPAMAETDYELDIEYDEHFYSLEDVIGYDTAIIEEEPEA